MASVDIEVRFGARCHECGNELDEFDSESVLGRHGMPGRTVLVVEPCEHCINEARESRDDEIAELSEVIAGLKAELEELRNG
jgi:hypothetical protein